jgi:hypothetical protein
LKRAALEDDSVTPTIVTDAKDTRPSKRTRTQISEQEEEEAEERHDAENAAEAAIDERIRGPAESLAKRFVKWLSKRGRKEKGDDGREEDSNANEEEDDNDDEEEDGDDRDVAMRKRDFISDLINYQRATRHSDDGQMLEKMMRVEIRQIAKDRRQALWRLWYSHICVQLLRFSEDPDYSETGDCHKEKVERHKRHACLILNGIVNGLWTALRQRALLFYRFLAGKIVASGSARTATNTNQKQKTRLTRVSRLEQSHRQRFIELVLELVLAELSNIAIPASHHHVPNPALVIAWLRGRE